MLDLNIIDHREKRITIKNLKQPIPSVKTDGIFQRVL